MQPLFSIIIPHYDIPDLLMRCLKSITVSEDIQIIDRQTSESSCMKTNIEKL